MRDKCDKCLTPIVNNRCSCGMWYNENDHTMDSYLIESVIYLFNSYGTNEMSGDHHTGTAFVFFKGNYEDCEAVKRFLEERKCK